MSKKLVTLTRNLVRANQPLLVPVYKADGTLMAQKGIVLTEDQVSTLDGHAVLYTLGKELASLSPSYRREAANYSYQWRSPFERLTELRNNLISLYADPNDINASDNLNIIIGRVHTLCREAPDAALATIIIDTNEYYTAQHAVHVAILCELTAEALSWDDQHRRALVGAALSMNISVADFQDDCQAQETPLDEAQRAVLKDHPQKSVDILRNMGVDNERLLEYVLKHHEDLDGSGYPSGLMGDEIPLGASILHLTDVYAAKVSSSRTYRPALFPNIAARQIFLGKDRGAKGTAIEILVKILGLYPPGCQVKLASGEVGVVVRRGNRVDAPYVLAVFDAKGNRQNTKVVRNTANQNYAIKEIIHPNTIKQDPSYPSFWGY